MKISLLLTLLKLMFSVESAAVKGKGVVGRCPDEWTFYPDNGHCYYISDQYAKFDVADKDCKAMNSSLASFQSYDEHLFVLPLIFVEKLKCTALDDCLNYWIGLFNRNAICNRVQNWTWTDGSPMTKKVNYWEIGFPAGKHRCGSLSLINDPLEVYGSWKDEYCKIPLRYICKKMTGLSKTVD